MDENRTFFFAFDIKASWPEKEPTGRSINKSSRHITLSYIGKENFEKIETLIKKIPLPSFKVGVAGILDKMLFFPSSFF